MSTPGHKPVPRRPLPARELLLLGLLVALLLLGTLPPLINLGRYQRSIARAISHAIGRSVGMDSVSLQMLPWPGFRIENLTVDEDPAFGQEPALRAPEVVLEPSLSSLWRGHFEISKVELSDASVNLVRDADGRWNISSVLLQASHLRNAPTGAHHAGQTPRFPYIAATDTRINFKRGAEKMPYSILNADFAMWLDRPGVWGLRLEGQPARTDLPMASGDTGSVQLSGEIDRASALGAMPVKLDGEWSHMPLGQAGRLLLGRDTGWRGQADLSASFTGEIDDLGVHAHLFISNLHWQDFTPEEVFSPSIGCSGHYSRSAPATDSFRCRWPLGDGGLTVASDAVMTGESRTLSLKARQVPASVLAEAAGLLHSGMPAPEVFSGSFNGRMSYAMAGRVLTGSFSAAETGIAGAAADGGTLQVEHVMIRPAAGAAPALAVSCDPFSLGVISTPVQLAAILQPHGYSVNVQGAATLQAMNSAAAALHLPLLTQLSAAEPGAPAARLALSAASPWRNSGPTGFLAGVMGTVRLANVAWQPGWLDSPVVIPEATLSLSPGTVQWAIPAATLEAGMGQPLRFAAALDRSLACVPGASCLTHFTVSAPELSTAELATAFATGHGALVSRLLAQLDPGRVRLPAVAGTLRLQTFAIGRLPIHDAVVQLATEDTPDAPPRIRIESVEGQALGGTLHMAGTVSAAAGAPVYALQIDVSNASAVQAAALWHTSWGPGVFNGTASLKLGGTGMEDLLSSAAGTVDASWLGGSLGRALPHFASWNASGVIGADGLTLDKGTLSGTGSTLVGSIGWDRTIHLTLTPAPGAEAQTINGSLQSPQLAPESR